jgi:hypothetical protein
MTTNILAPFSKNENTSTFYVNGRLFEMNDTVIKEVEITTSTNINKAIAAFESFEFSNEKVTWFHGASRFVYNLAEGTFTNNGTLIAEGTFTNHVLASGLVRYENKGKAELFESLPTLIENFVVLDFAATFEGNSNIVNVFKIEEKVFVSRFNTANKIGKFFEATANEASTYITEQTGENANSFLTELLEGETAETAKKALTIETYQDMVAFLKDQRGLLATADKSIDEIKAADLLINSEIKIWESKITELNA